MVRYTFLSDWGLGTERGIARCEASELAIALMAEPITLQTTAVSASEDALAALVDRWTGHMRWRPDFTAWRERRLWQERYQQRRLEQLAGIVGPLSGKAVLEVGSGMGGLAVALARAGARVVAIEPHRAYCRIGTLRAARYSLRLPLVTAMGEELPVRDNVFDLVTCLDVLEHADDPWRTLREIGRAMRPGGRAVVTATNRFAFRDPHYHLRGINWLPRSWATTVVKWRMRLKAHAGFGDRQELSTMHYVSWGQFTRQCRALGFDAVDAREGRVRSGPLPAGTRFRRTIVLMRRLRLAVPAYRVYRAAFVGTFEVVLLKPGTAR